MVVANLVLRLRSPSLRIRGIKRILGRMYHNAKGRRESNDKPKKRSNRYGINKSRRNIVHTVFDDRRDRSSFRIEGIPHVKIKQYQINIKSDVRSDASTEAC